VYAPDVEKAPEPEDIIWLNIGRTDCNTNLRKVFTFTVTAILLGGCFMIVYGLTKAQQNSNNDRAISIAISIVIAVVNIALGRAYFLIQW
jgi:magnesium-transporting ATPase (P-type)